MAEHYPDAEMPLSDLNKVMPGEPPEFESYSMTADQQIRAKALECACLVTDMFWANVREFERYIQGK